MLRQITILMLAGALAISACGRKGDPVPPSPSPAQSTEEQKKTN